MAGSIRLADSALLESRDPALVRLALDMACELSDLQRRAAFGCEMSRREGYEEGRRARGHQEPR